MYGQRDRCWRSFTPLDAEGTKLLQSSEWLISDVQMNPLGEGAGEKHSVLPVPHIKAQAKSVTVRKEMLGQPEIQVVDGSATDYVSHECDTEVVQQSGTLLATPQISVASLDVDECRNCLKDEPYGLTPAQTQRGLQPNCKHDYPSTWSGPEGSSHSGNIVCRGVAGGAASIS